MFPSPILGPPLSAFTVGSNPNNPRDQVNSSTNQNPGGGNHSNSTNTNNSQLPIRPIPFHSGTNLNLSSTGPSPGFLSPSELKNLQMKFHAMRNETGPSQSSGSENSNSPIPSSLAQSQQQSFHQQIHQHQQHSVHHQHQAHAHAHAHAYPTSSSQPVISNPVHSPIPSQTGSGSNNSGTTTTGPQFPSIPPASSPSPSSSSSTSSNSHHYTLPNGISLRIPADQLIPSHFLETRLRTRSEPNSPASADSPQPTTPTQNLDSRSSISPVPFLQDHEIEKITESAVRVLQSLPDYMGEPRITAKRKSSADFEVVTHGISHFISQILFQN